jgi:hypothetical protein
MTPSERNLLIWCGIMLVRDTPLTPAETAVIDVLIAEVRGLLACDVDQDDEYPGEDIDGPN